MAYNPGTLEERFSEKVARGADAECWLWQANKNNKGYGMFYPGHGKHKKLAHRISYEMANGPIPDGMNVLHRCDTPLCVNPAHLFLGSFKDNTRDMMAKGRARYGICPTNKPPHKPGAANANAKLTDEIVREARKQLAAGAKLRPMARALGVNASTLRRIRDRKGWKHVP